MSIGDAVKIDRAWKLSLDKAMTGVEKNYYEELYSSGRIVHKDEVWKDDIPANPANAVAAGVAAEKDHFVLTEITSVSGKRAWVAESGGLRISDWISPRFGPGYTVEIFDQDDNQIYTTDPCNWVFDYKAGILFLEHTKPGITSFKVSGYVYTGAKGVGGETGDFASKHIEEVTTPTLQVVISNVHELVDVPGAVVQIYESDDGNWVEVLAQVKWSSDWHTLTIDFAENFTGKIVLVG